MKDYYNILGVKSDATLDEIRVAYKKLAKQYHPDRNSGNLQAEQKFKQVSEAYQNIGTEEKRRQYDMQRNGNFSGDFFNGFGHNPFGFSFQFGGNSFTDIFESFSRGLKDIKVYLNITFEQMCKGVEKEIQYERNNEGKTQKVKFLVKIPAGIMNGMNLSFAGQGNILRGRTSSLIVSIKVLAHQIYKRDNYNVRYTMPISLNQAINGDVIQVITPKDGKIKIKIPVCSNSCFTMRIANKGLPVLKRDGLYGDVIIDLQVQLPQNLTDEQKNKLNDFLSNLTDANYNQTKKFKERIK